MAFNAVAGQFRKWRRNSSYRESSSSTSREEDKTVNSKENNDKNKSRKSTSDAPKPSTGKSRKPPAKEYPPSSDSLLNGIGDYTFVRQIGQGKFSRVMLSLHCLTRNEVAIKIIDKRAYDYRVMSRLVREIPLMEALDHPNIIKLYETYETTDSLYVVMEYVDGFNLDEYLQKREGCLSEVEARDIFRQMAAAMDYCHSRWVVHRDLKTPNILLTKDLKVKIADFGLGNRFGRRRLKTICGSMLYYSPEIINGQGYTGPEVDCWCLGVSLYRMTVGEEPFSHANTVGELRKDVTLGKYTIPNYLSPSLRNTISKCMAIDKVKRSRVQTALKDDPWLFDYGRLPNIFTYNSPSLIPSSAHDDDEQIRVRKERERLKIQHLRDMEEEKRTRRVTRKTIICHPKSPSIYFTSAIPHSSKPEDKFTNSETQRHILFQKINEISHHIKLTQTPHGNKASIRHLLRKLKHPEAGNGSSTHSSHIPEPPSTVSSGLLVRKSTSNMSLSQIYQRVAKDQVHYYTFQCTSQTIQRLLMMTESPSSSIDNANQDEFVMMLVIKGICDIMGITYHRDKPDHLVCVMALNDYTEEKHQSFYKLKRRDSKITTSTPTLSFIDQDGSQTSFSRSSGGQSDTTRSSQLNSSKFSKLKRMTSNVLSSMFPYHSSTLVVHDNRSIKYPPLPTHLNRENWNKPCLSQSSHHSVPTPEDDSTTHEKKGGVAVFAIEILSVSHPTKDSDTPPSQRVIAIKLSKLQGSSKVFRIACGWITAVIGQNITPTQFNASYNNIIATSISSVDIPTALNFMPVPNHTTPLPGSKRLYRPKSVITLLPSSNTTSLHKSIPTSSSHPVFNISPPTSLPPSSSILTQRLNSPHSSGNLISQFTGSSSQSTLNK
ncbi:kinase-like domain-containing protein [Pilobolus umbonatus]|nr:kinase-like domain-containing protein [Pilobolus umbonatus]